MQLRVQLQNEQTDTLYTFVATTKPQMKVTNYDTLGDGTTKTIEIDYPTQNANITNYYSLDNGATWNVYTGEINVPNVQRENVLAKIEYREGTTINKAVSYFEYIDLIKFSEVTWENGKASIEISSLNTKYIEYQVNDTLGTWQSGTKVENLQLGDTVYARINNNGEYTEEKTKVIHDGIKPEEFTVTTSDLTYNNVKLTTTGTTDNQTGLASYTYVAENNGNIVQEIPNQTVKEYPITGLEEQTEYVVYMLAYDNAGNVRKSNEVKVTTLEYVPPQIGNVSEETRTGNNLDAEPYNYSWDEIEKLAKAISDDNRNTITYTTTQLTITMDGKTYTLGVGDYKNVKYGTVDKQVRILGFNHDILADLDDTTANSINHYGGSNTYAGISFEFVDFITSAAMNNTNVGGWKSCSLRTTLNSETTLNNINIGSKIKEVTKTYNTGYNNFTNSTCTDKLWLLSCSEIWKNGYSGYVYGYCNTEEGEQYAFYSMNNKSCGDSTQKATRKPTESNKNYWWLRSTYYGTSDGFCDVAYNGTCHGTGAHISQCVAPGFSI